MANKHTAGSRALTFADVREIALSMPEVEEVTAFGMPAFKAGKTRFVGQPVPRSDVAPNSIGIPMSFEERTRLLAAKPGVYYVTEHFAPYPAVLVRLSSIDRAELRKILSAAWHYAMEQGSAKTTRAKTKTRGRQSPRRTAKRA